MEPINIILSDETEETFIPTGDHCIKEVLETICEKHGLDPSGYDNYFLSNDFRLKTLNLQRDEQLKLVEDFRPTQGMSVTVTLRIKDSHVSANFHPNVTLWKVVENLVAAVTLRIPLSTPILIRKGVEYIGREDLMQVTPNSLGYTSGYLYFRFLVIENTVLSKRTGGLLGSSESLQFELTKNLDDSGSFIQRVVSNLKATEEESPVITFYPGIARRSSSVFEEINYIGNRNAVASRLPHPPQTPLTTEQNSSRDSFYNMHVEDVKVMFKLIDEKRKELKERMITIPVDPVDKISVAENKFTVIRIQFPDRTILQAFFNANDKIKDVGEFVKLYRRVPRKFEFITKSPKVVMESEKTLAECGLVPIGKLYYKLQDEEQPVSSAYLKEKVLRRLTSHEGACYAAALVHHVIQQEEEEPVVEDEEPDELNLKNAESVRDSHFFMLRQLASRKSYFRF
nr:uncharacterized protein LOC106677860 isoform X2 [Halyomorpha halys]